MKNEKEIKVILNRLQEINTEKEPFLPIKPLTAEASPKIWSIAEFRRYGELCKEEEKLLADLEKLES